MAGPYLYLFIALAILGLLGFKMYLRTRTAIHTHRPTLPINDDDIVTAVRAKRMVEAIQLYGVLYRCDLTEATLAVTAMAAQLKAVEAECAEPNGSEEQPGDHRET